MTNRVSKKEYIRKLSHAQEIYCGRCRSNRGENANHHKPRPDKYKNKRG